MKIGIDLSLRSAGLTAKNEKELYFDLIQIPKLKNEELLVNLISRITDFISKHSESLEYINLEGLSFNSVSSSKDVIAGSWWYLRIKIKELFPHIPLNIVPVLSWRNPLFSKEEQQEIKNFAKKLRIEKKKVKGLKGQDRKEAVAFNKKLKEDLPSIKEKTFEKLPEEIQNKILEITSDTAKYDLTDSFFIATFDPKDLKVKIKKTKKSKNK